MLQERCVWSPGMGVFTESRVRLPAACTACDRLAQHPPQAGAAAGWDTIQQTG
jgi:hypothetical protein